MTGYPCVLLLFPATEHFGIVFTAGYPKLLQLLMSHSALLLYPRLLIKVTITSFLEPALFDSAVVDAVKITVPLYLLLYFMVTHSGFSLSSSSCPSKLFSTSSSFSLLSYVLGTLFFALPSQTTPQMDGEVSSSLWNSGNYQEPRAKQRFFFSGCLPCTIVIAFAHASSHHLSCICNCISRFTVR